jgi:Transition state regulatory protein AbrB
VFAEAAVPFHHFVGKQDRVTAHFSGTPADLTKMGLIGLAINADVAFVALHYVVRILIVIVVAPLVLEVALRRRETAFGAQTALGFESGFSTRVQCRSFGWFRGAILMQDKKTDGIDRGTASAAGPGPVLLSDEVVDFIQSGVSAVIAIVGPDGRARPGRALGSRVLGDGTIRLLYPAEGNAAVEAFVQSGGPIAVTFSSPVSHRTIQIKALSCRAETLAPADQISAERQAGAFGAILASMGYAPVFVKAICGHRLSHLRVLSFAPEAAFEQTPGPGAGRAI